MKLWVPPLVFCVLGLAFLSAYRLVLADDAEIGQGLLDRRAAELEELRRLSADLTDLRARAQKTKDEIAVYYEERLATEEEKLTEIISEIKQLARQAGLEPGAISYEKDRNTRQNVVERTLVFEVVGSYPQLRQLVNFLELSESFLMLKAVSLRAADESGSRLGIDLQIGTLFSVAGETGERGEA